MSQQEAQLRTAQETLWGTSLGNSELCLRSKEETGHASAEILKRLGI